MKKKVNGNGGSTSGDKLAHRASVSNTKSYFPSRSTTIHRKFVVCIATGLTKPAGQNTQTWSKQTASRPTTTRSRSPEEARGCTKCQLQTYETTQRHPMRKMPCYWVDRLSWRDPIDRSAPKLAYNTRLHAHTKPRFPSLKLLQVSIGTNHRRKWATTARRRGRRWRGCRPRWRSRRSWPTGRTWRWSSCLTAPSWPPISTSSASASSSTGLASWPRFPRSAKGSWSMYGEDEFVINNASCYREQRVVGWCLLLQFSLSVLVMEWIVNMWVMPVLFYIPTSSKLLVILVLSIG